MFLKAYLPMIIIDDESSIVSTPLTFWEIHNTSSTTRMAGPWHCSLCKFQAFSRIKTSGGGEESKSLSYCSCYQTYRNGRNKVFHQDRKVNTYCVLADLFICFNRTQRSKPHFGTTSFSPKLPKDRSQTTRSHIHSLLGHMITYVPITQELRQLSL